jgi:hypothetical protein
MNPAQEAIRQKIQAIHKLNADKKAIAKHFPEEIDGVYLTEIKEQTDLLKQACPFYWTKEMVQSVYLSTKTLPNSVVLKEDWLQSKYGFWWLGKDTGISAYHGFSVFTNKKESLCAISHVVIGTEVKIMGWTLDHQEPTGGPAPAWVLFWNFERSLEDQLKIIKDTKTEIPTTLDKVVTMDFSEGNEKVIKFFAAGCLWMQQKILITKSIHVNTHEKRAAKRHGINPEIKLIMLRRRDVQMPKEHDENTTEEVKKKDFEWHVQWIVRGHWRNQYYPSIKENRTIWIDPYNKGPEDKPLINPEKIFIVNR